MKLKLISDIHLNHYGGASAQRWENLNREKADVLVIAGDIGEDLKQKASFIELACNKFDKVIAIDGNHDLFYLSFEEEEKNRNNLNSKYSNLHFVDNQVVTINEYKFVCSTMWFGVGPLDPNPNRWVDSCYIKGKYPAIKEHHEKSMAFLEENVTEGSIVVTHHLPSYRCISDRWVGNPYNNFFANECTSLLEKKPKLWLHGHSHDRLNGLKINETYCYRNPYGYPTEDTKFDIDFVIDLKDF